jgi:outer membrane receptor protein involved in Fe transport
VFRTGINYHAFRATYIRASIGQGYRFPSIAERFIRTSIGGANIFPNPDLKSERGLSFEAGIKQGVKIGNLQGYFDIAAFQNNYYDMIEFVFAQWATDLGLFKNLGFKSLNVGDTRIRGLEINLTLEDRITDNILITAQVGYTFLDPRQLSYDSTYITKIGPDNVEGSDSTDFLKYRYQHMLRANAGIKWKKLLLGVDIRYNSRMENMDKIFVNGLLDLAFPPGLGIGDYRTHHNHGDIVFDTRIAYDLSKNFNLAFIVKNVFNYIYMQRPADMQPPRSFALMVSARF